MISDVYTKVLLERREHGHLRNVRGECSEISRSARGGVVQDGSFTDLVERRKWNPLQGHGEPGRHKA